MPAHALYGVLQCVSLVIHVNHAYIVPGHALYGVLQCVKSGWTSSSNHGIATWGRGEGSGGAPLPVRYTLDIGIPLVEDK